MRVVKPCGRARHSVADASRAGFARCRCSRPASPVTNDHERRDPSRHLPATRHAKRKRLSSPHLERALAWVPQHCTFPARGHNPRPLAEASPQVGDARQLAKMKDRGWPTSIAWWTACARRVACLTGRPRFKQETFSGFAANIETEAVGGGSFNKPRMRCWRGAAAHHASGAAGDVEIGGDGEQDVGGIAAGGGAPRGHGYVVAIRAGELGSVIETPYLAERPAGEVALARPLRSPLTCFAPCGCCWWLSYRRSSPHRARSVGSAGSASGSGTSGYVDAGTHLGGRRSPGDTPSPGPPGPRVPFDVVSLAFRGAACPVRAKRFIARKPQPRRFDCNLVMVGAGPAGLLAG